MGVSLPYLCLSRRLLLGKLYINTTTDTPLKSPHGGFSCGGNNPSTPTQLLYIRDYMK